MGIRRKAREAALQILYQIDASGASCEDAVRTYWTHLAATPDAEEFASELVRGVDGHLARIDDTIRNVSHHWRLERMTRVDRNIIRLATFELLEMADIPRRVTLNEAIELAKRFGAEGSAKFVNGVLDRIASDAGKV
jgi:N utilization substance protein B